MVSIVVSLLLNLSRQRQLFIVRRFYGNSYSGRCRVTSTTVVTVECQDLAENMQDFLNSWFGINTSFRSNSRKTPQMDSWHFCLGRLGFLYYFKLILRTPKD
ncbi:uncharacterized protein BKA55DRAFT_248512 [Fusarium redolens]|uniref:Uncharacterized protein n=1 Tax=Fusarium redolens TaxID=48865 RepID=A0A9P9KJJ5_FUSRE|nr:uncharacterized protein BKA55DRAFT_248512 [Fusarium redolens]KAH7265347.1 hypothetical protein BKA55DRAFT_248512 [Fusarium redolens]